MADEVGRTVRVDLEGMRPAGLINLIVNKEDHFGIKGKAGTQHVVIFGWACSSWRNSR